MMALVAGIKLIFPVRIIELEAIQMYEFEIRNGVPKTHLLMLRGTRNDLFEYLSTEYGNGNQARLLKVATGRIKRTKLETRRIHKQIIHVKTGYKPRKNPC